MVSRGLSDGFGNPRCRPGARPVFCFAQTSNTFAYESNILTDLKREFDATETDGAGMRFADSGFVLNDERNSNSTLA
jgi:hypothetical protein